MLRQNSRGRLRSTQKPKEDINPMNGVANLVDAMLVLAVGIMLALILSWNLNVSSTGQVSADAQSQEENVSKDDAVTSFTGDDMESADSEEVMDEGNLEEQGTVYYDKSTDTYYIITSDGSQKALDGDQ